MSRETGHECLGGSHWSSSSPQDGEVRPGEGDVGERPVQPVCAGPKWEESQTQSPAEKSQRTGGIYWKESIEVKMCVTFHHDTTSHDRKHFQFNISLLLLGNPMMTLHSWLSLLVLCWAHFPVCTFFCGKTKLKRTATSSVLVDNCGVMKNLNCLGTNPRRFSPPMSCPWLRHLKESYFCATYDTRMSCKNNGWFQTVQQIYLCIYMYIII